ncbi:MAG: ferredoxin--NADP reductase [Herminiimonas sp.]|nr:ferredoxin--NADP reductase [Herminiimonas sp.]
MSIEAIASEKATPETVTQVHRWTDSLFSFKTTRPQGYRFTPGQYARLGLAADGGMLWRAYSITSAPDDDFLEYYGIVVPGGAFTTILKDIRPGDTIWTEKQSYGFMTADRFSDGEDLWMLATGTGLGPFISILRDPMVWEKFRHLILVHCVRHEEEFVYQEELAALKNHPPTAAPRAELQLVRSATRDTAAPSAHFGQRITALLENGALEKRVGFGLSEQSSRIMLCGNPEMIDDTRRILHQRGLRPCRRTLPGQFVTENYW